MKSVLIPEDRVGVVRKAAKTIERETGVRLSLRGNEVFVDGGGLEEYLAELVIKAIGRGFPPETALLLTEEGNRLEILKIPAKNDSLVRIRSRLIGTRGKTRRIIEFHTGCRLSIYGKTVSIIGPYEGVRVAKKAVEMLISGSPHGRVYSFLRKHGKSI